jgi:8-oxo-dGTP diphosphatase
VEQFAKGIKMSYTYPYPMQSVTADAVVFCRDEVLLIKRNIEPFKGQWALPGGHFDQEDQNTKITADRELKEETGIDVNDKNVFLTGQVGSYSEINRDPRGRYITVAYFYCMIQKTEIVIQEDEVKEAKWFNVLSLKKDDVAFDHYDIICDAHVMKIKIMLESPISDKYIFKKWSDFC